MRRIFTLLAPLAVAACMAAPAPSLYLLEAPKGAAAPPAESGGASIGLREIALPLYARRLQIAAQDESGAITAADERRWAEEPPRAATRLLARRLAAIRGAPAYADPWPQGAAPDLIATVDVDRFLGGLGGDVDLVGQLTISRADRRGGAATTPFAITAPVEGDDYAALTAAYAAALAELAQLIAGAADAY
ncbi:membrane integrity-associated transporter subunit PqiC [Pikeienuella sp. HZG-20]|uniref:PqiC family protein n=1 Tax=Paludibacillus litoralis TaxID=3133267 RepID=UPI0030EDA9DE